VKFQQIYNHFLGIIEVLFLFEPEYVPLVKTKSPLDSNQYYLHNFF